MMRWARLIATAVAAVWMLAGCGSTAGPAGAGASVWDAAAWGEAWWGP